MTDSQVLISPGTIWNLVKNGKGWLDPLLSREEKTENLSDNRFGTKGFGD